MAVDAGDSMTMTAEVLMTDAADAAVEAEAPMTGAADAAVAPMTGAADAAETPMTGAAVMAEIPGADAEIIRMTENAVRSGKVSGTAGAAATGRGVADGKEGLSRCLLGPGFQRRRVLRRLNFCKADKTDNDA